MPAAEAPEYGTMRARSNPLRPPLRPSTRVGADEPDHALAAAGRARRSRHFTVTGVARLLGHLMGGHVPNVGQELDQGEAEVGEPSMRDEDYGPGSDATPPA